MEMWVQYALGGGGIMGFVKFTLDVIKFATGTKNGKPNGKPSKELECKALGRPRCIDDQYYRDVIKKTAENTTEMISVLNTQTEVLKAIRDNGKYRPGGN